MYVSTTPARMPHYTIQRGGSTGSPAGFAGLMASAGKNDVGPSSEPAGSPRTGAGRVVDFRNMTSAGFKAQAQAMYDRGEIDLTALGVMQVAGNTDDGDGASGAETFDFTTKIRSMMEFESRSGHRASPLSPYKIYENILSKITPRAGANLIG